VSSLLENIINNKNQNLKFDFSKSIFENIAAVRDLNPSDKLPIVTKKTSWETISDKQETYMFKSYSFKFNKHLIYFVTSILEKANNIYHHPIILINEDIVEIKLITKSINDVTELDLEYSRFIDEIYEEINYILEF